MNNWRLKQVWQNYVNDQSADPLRLYPQEQLTTLPQLIEIIKDANGKKYKVKAVGSGDSSSDIALTRDYMLDTHGLCRVLDMNQLTLNCIGKANSNNLRFIEGGIVIRDLVKILEKEEKGLINMGGYDGQTIAGAVSTSTHGSGINIDSFPGFVRAIILVTENAEVWHIEPSKGISVKEVKLDGVKISRFIQDDNIFNAVVVSMGCMGIIYALVIEVRDFYDVRETRCIKSWEKEVKPHLNTYLQQYSRVEILVNPYKHNRGQYQGGYNCLLTLRTEVNNAKNRSLLPRGHRNRLLDIGVTILSQALVSKIIASMLNWFPKWTPGFVKTAFNSLREAEYKDKYYKVFNIGLANNLSGFGLELCFPSTTYLNAIDVIFDIVKKSAKDGEQYLNGPFSMRFVKTNNFYLSMQHNRTGKEDDYVCTIEFLMLKDIVGGRELLDRIEDEMYNNKEIDFKMAPHWGEVNSVCGVGNSAIGRLYKDYHKWLCVYRQLAPNGMFENYFTQRCGIK